MERLGWKITAIIFIVLFISLVSIITWGVYLITEEENNRNECYWDICEGSPYAEWNTVVQDNVCYCLDENYEVTKTTLLS